jgi:sugar fermentation stimulation protein A
VACDGGEVAAHVPNTGRMRELLRPGARAFLTPAPEGSARKTEFDLTLIEKGRELVSVDSRLPNLLLHEAAEAGSLPQFAGYAEIRREVVFEDSRIDLLLSGGCGQLYIEAKSVNLVEAGLALFPDAPTERGRKHLGTLAKAVAQGHRAAVVFVIQRQDAVALSPYRDADPLFSDALSDAVALGVEAYAYTCRVSTKEIEIDESVPVRLA